VRRSCEADRLVDDRVNAATNNPDTHRTGRIQVNESAPHASGRRELAPAAA